MVTFVFAVVVVAVLALVAAAAVVVAVVVLVGLVHSSRLEVQVVLSEKTGWVATLTVVAAVGSSWLILHLVVPVVAVTATVNVNMNVTGQCSLLWA